MSKKCPHVVQIDTDTHKILKLVSAELNIPMGQIVKLVLIDYVVGETKKFTGEGGVSK